MKTEDFKKGITYKLKAKSGQIFTGKLIHRGFGLGPALNGRNKNGRACHLPLISIIDPAHGWELAL